MISATQIERLNAGMIIRHRVFIEMEELILRTIEHGQGDELVNIIGPAGIGKSSMILHITQSLIQRQRSGWRRETGPPVVVEAPSQRKGQFPMHEFIEDLLVALGEEDLNRKNDIDYAVENRKAGKKIPGNAALSIGKLQQLLRKRINALRPCVVIIDECQNLVSHLGLATRRDNLNTLKNWANTMDTKFMLFGTHECRELLNLNEQLSRRVSLIYFPRYQKQDKDLREFASVFLTLLNTLEVSFDDKIIEDFSFIYNHTLGCIGLMCTWLIKALSYAQSRKLNVLNRKILDETRMSFDRLATCEYEIKLFEEFVEKSREVFNPDLVVVQLPLDGIEPATSSKKVTRRKPGNKKPRRYSVE